MASESAFNYNSISVAESIRTLVVTGNIYYNINNSNNDASKWPGKLREYSHTQDSWTDFDLYSLYTDSENPTRMMAALHLFSMDDYNYD